MLMYKKEECSVKHINSFELEFNSYVNYLPTVVANRVDVAVKFSKKEAKKDSKMVGARSISITFLSVNLEYKSKIEL